MAKKRQRAESRSDAEPVKRAGSEDCELGPEAKKKRAWINRQRVLVLGCRGLSHRDRHLMEDLRTLMPHSKSESKMRRNKESLFVVNEMAEMKNCQNCLLFEGRLRRDLYLWAASVANGPSAKFRVINVHTMAELKMTGNCLKGSRPLLSFDSHFKLEANPHLSVIRELLVKIFGVPNHHPKSQPFFDRLYTFSFIDNKIWFRHYQILDSEDGSLAEIGPRFVMEPIKVFEASFSGRTLWENPDYVSPAAQRALLKRIKAGKYVQHLHDKAAYEANRPTEPTYQVDPTEDVFQPVAKSESKKNGTQASTAGAKMRNRKKAQKSKVKKKKKKTQAVPQPE